MRGQVRVLSLGWLAALCAFLAGCGGRHSSPISITLNPSASFNVDESSATVMETQLVTATVTGDVKNAGVNWTLSGTGSGSNLSCTGSACGTLSSQTSTSVVYTAPSGLTTTLTVTLKATSATDKSVSASATITVVLPPSITTTSLPNAADGVPYSQTIATTGGVSPLNFSVVSGSGSLPTGLHMNTTGLINGTPSCPTATNCPPASSFTVQVADSGNPPLVATQALSIKVNPAPLLSITATSLPSGNVGAAYRGTVTIQGGQPAFTWSLVSGNLPPGLSQDTSTGIITGTPTMQGTFSFTVQVQDSSLPVQTASASLSITIGAPLALQITTLSLPGGTTASPLNASVQATGGVQPYTWSLTNGQLPAGLALAASTGLISGTPIAAGTSTFTIQVADAESPPMTASARFSISVVANSTATNNNGLFSGQYVFLFNGFDSAGPEILGGILTADGKGKISSGTMDINSAAVVALGLSITGTYAMGSDGRGTLAITLTRGTGTVTFDYNMALDGNGNGRFEESDTTGNNGAGVLKKQLATAFGNGSLVGDYAFGVAGFDRGGHRSVFAGSFHADGSSTITLGNFDLNDNGTPTSDVAGGSGFFNIGGNGRSGFSLTIPGSTNVTRNYVAYLISATDFLLLSTDDLTSKTIDASIPRASGEAMRQATPFDSTALDGASVISGTGLDSAGNADVVAGLLTVTSGSPSLIFDENDGGTITPAGSPATGTLSIASNGRVAFTGLGAKLAVAYLAAPGRGFLIGTDSSATLGLLEAQPAISVGNFTNADFRDGYALGAAPPAEKNVANISGELASDGAGNFSGTIDEFTPPSTPNPGVSFSNPAGTPYQVSSNGRGTLTTNSPAGIPATLVFYIVSPGQYRPCPTTNPACAASLPGAIRVISSTSGDSHPQVFLLDH